jgi:ribosomal protein L32
VGWIKGRLINQPITRVNRRVYRARLTHRPFATLLLDFLKAFPSVLLHSMWAVMEAQGWHRDYINLFKYVHTDMIQVTKLFGTTHRGPVKRAGLWTGSGASTILLLCLIDVLLRELYRSPGFSWDDEELASIDGFADDLTGFFPSPWHLSFFKHTVDVFKSWSGVGPSIPKTILVLPPWELENLDVWSNAIWTSIRIATEGETLGVPVGCLLTPEVLFRIVRAKFDQAVDTWMEKSLAKGDIALLWNCFLLPRLSYLAQFFCPPKSLLAHLTKVLKRIYRVGPSFPGILLHYSDWILRENPGPLMPEAWYATVMLRAAHQMQPDLALASDLNSHRWREGSIDWQQCQLPKRLSLLGVNFKLLHKRMLSIAYRLGILPVYKFDQAFDGILWRLYTDGSVKNSSVGSSAVLFFGNIEVFRVWGAVQFDPRGRHYWGARTVSSGTGELNALLLFCKVVEMNGFWPLDPAVRAAWSWPSSKLLFCCDSSTALQVVAGAAVGSTEPALSALLYDTSRTFFHDRDIDLALQKVPAHAGIPGNETADSSAKAATNLEPGAWELTYRGLIPSVAVSLQKNLGARQLACWPEPPAHRGKVQGAQTCTYLHIKGKTWLAGTVGTTVTIRLQRWWGRSFNFTWLLNLFTLNKHEAPRLKWCVYTALLGEWPTGCKLRHWSAQPNVKPLCRFCNSAEDDVRHWFGPNCCPALVEKKSRSSPLDSLDLTNGWFGQQSVSAWHLVFTAVYAVHSMLRWKIGPAGNHTATLREGIWLARCHEIEEATNALAEKQARKQSANRQARHRAKQKRLDLQASLRVCDQCGQVYGVATVHNCPT